MPTSLHARALVVVCHGIRVASCPDRLAPGDPAQTSTTTCFSPHLRRISQRSSMDAKFQNAELEALIRRNDLARQAMAEQWHLLQHRIDLPSRLGEHIRSNRTYWFAGSAILGLVSSAWFRKKPEPPRNGSTSRKGLVGLALGAAFTLAKPAIKTWLWSELQKRFLSRHPLSPGKNSPHRFSD